MFRLHLKLPVSVAIVDHVRRVTPLGWLDIWTVPSRLFSVHAIRDRSDGCTPLGWFGFLAGPTLSPNRNSALPRIWPVPTYPTLSSVF